MKNYEGMFLLDPSLAGDVAAAEAEIKRILDRAGASLIGLKNWEERKLAYDMGGFKRGLYVLTYFRCDPLKIEGIERDVQLGEKTIRVLIIRRDKMSDEKIAQSLAAGPPPKTFARGGDEWGGGGGERGGDRWGGDRGGRRDRARAPEGDGGATAVKEAPEADADSDDVADVES